MRKMKGVGIDDKELSLPAYSPVCGACLHQQGRRRCKAFVGLIPAAIWEGKDLHKKRVRGDHGITFAPRE